MMPLVLGQNPRPASYFPPMSIWTSNQRLVLRRARADFDGPYPVYAVMGGQKMPLSKDQIGGLNQQALNLAEQPAPKIKIVLSKMLEADRFGTEPPMDIAGFIRQSEPYEGTRAATVTNAPNSCDQCGRDLNYVGYFLDACTIEKQMWSWMCAPCFFALGCGVGNGYGQLYLREDDDDFLVFGAD